VNAPRTIPRTILAAALQSLGVDVVLDEILSVTVTPTAVTVMTWPNFDLLNWRLVNECPSCHTADGHPHTEYCQAAKVRTCRVCGCTDLAACPGGCAWVSGEPDLCTACRPTEVVHPPAAPGVVFGFDKSGAEPLNWPAGYHAEPEPWVDDGCRCPSRDNHQPGCPTMPQPDPDFEDPGISENGK
jgi:hypothetical protein